MKKLALIGKNGIGKYALVDDEDFESLSQWKWHANNGYATRSYSVKMHRVIMQAEKGTTIDHINRNKLDNRKENLRFCNHSQNRINSGLDRSNTSGYKGVYWYKTHKNWRSMIRIGKKKITKESKTLELAIIKRKELEDKYWNFR